MPWTDGQSLAELARGEVRVEPVRMEYAAEGSYAPLVALRQDKWKYTHCELDPPQLFDLEADPHELTNLADDPAFNKVKKELASWLPKYNAPDSEVVKWPDEQERVMKILNSIRK